MMQVQRSTAVRIGIVAAVVVALGVGFGIGYAVHSPTSAPTKTTARNTGGTGTYQHFFENTTTTFAVSSTTTSSTPTSNPARQVLSPATTPPVSDECSIPITQTADGNPTPAICPGGGVNVLAWDYMVQAYANILGLGANATIGDVFQVLCNIPNPVGGEVSEAAQEAATYYGWSFGKDVSNWYPNNPTYCSH
jgi:hypothetical protein